MPNLISSTSLSNLTTTSTTTIFDPWPAWNVLFVNTTAITTGTVTNQTVWTAFNEQYVNTINSATTAMTQTVAQMGTVIGSTLNTISANQTVWTAFNEQYATLGASSVRHYGSQQVDPEVAARRVREAEEYRQRQVVAEGELSKARDRAEKLLHEALSPIQLEDLKANGHFHLEVHSQNGDSRRYRIKRGRSRNVQQVDASGKVLKHFCIHPREAVPDADTMLAQKLWLETMEQEFLRIANHS